MDDIKRPRKPKLTVQPNTVEDFNANSAGLHSDKDELAFKLPEQVADEDIAAAASENIPDPRDTTTKPNEEQPMPGKKRKLNFNLHMPHGKKQWIITILVAVLLLGGGASGYWFILRNPTKPVAVVVKPPKKVVPPKPTTEASKLSGLEVPIGTNQKPITAVQIENSPDSRPQSGLKEASVIFEAVAEGGITRFNAIFQDTTPDYVGPVRSLRPYYIDWFWPFDAAIAHVGGSPQAQSDVKALGIKDLDQFFNSGSYDRITSRYAPHNVYTSIGRLNDLQVKKGFTTSDYTGFERKKESKIAVPTAKNIDLAISSYFYNVHYSYDVTTNSYFRSEGGAPHLDFKSNAQLAPKVVIAIVMSRGKASDGSHTEYTTIGSGQMYVFQDGIVQPGTWSKSSRQSQWVFTGTDSKPLKLNPGQTWISMVDSTGSVTYVP